MNECFRLLSIQYERVSKDLVSGSFSLSIELYTKISNLK